MLTNCPEVLLFGTNWQTCRSLVSEQNMLDQSPNGQELVTDVQLVTFHTFITQMTTDKIVMWGTRLSIVDLVYLKTQILLATLRTMCLWKSNICHHKLDVREANVSVSQFNRIRSYFVRRWLANGQAPCSRFVRRGDRSVTFIEEYRIANP